MTPPKPGLSSIAEVDEYLAINNLLVNKASGHASSRREHRARYLALRYTSPHDLVAFESRMNTWRSELSDNLKIPESKWLPYAAAAALEVNDIPSAAPRSAVRGGLAEWPPKIWCEKWRAPYIPHHMRGDPLTLASKEAYVNNCETYRLDLRRQAITVELSKLQERLPLCVTAEQGVAALKAIRRNVR